MIKILQKIFFVNWLWLAGLLLLLLSLQQQIPAWAQNTDPCTTNRATIPFVDTLTFTLTEGLELTYPLQLCNPPSQPVTITIEMDEPGKAQLSVKPTEQRILFTKLTWATPQVITITANQDQLIETLQTSVIKHPAQSSDPAFNYSSHPQSLVEIRLVDDDQGSFLPVIAKPLATPIPQVTPTPQASWQKFTNSPPHVDVVTTYNGGLFAGDRSDANNLRGIYQAQECSTTVQFSQKQSGIQVRDLAFHNNFGIAAVNGDRVYYSSDSGQSWRRTNDNINRFVFAATFAQNGDAYVGTDEGVYSSTNKGVNWSKVTPSQGENPRLIIDFYYDLSDDRLWIATEGFGISRFTLATKGFETVSNGLSGKAMEVWDITKSSSGDLYAATSDGVYKYNGTSWTSFGLSGLQVLSLEAIDNLLYAGRREGGVYRKALNGAADWVQESGLAANLTVRDLLYDQNGPCKALLAGTTDGIWVYR